MLRVCALLALATVGQCYIAPASFLPASRSVSCSVVVGAYLEMMEWKMVPYRAGSNLEKYLQGFRKMPP